MPLLLVHRCRNYKRIYECFRTFSETESKRGFESQQRTEMLEEYAAKEKFSTFYFHSFKIGNYDIFNVNNELEKVFTINSPECLKF